MSATKPLKLYFKGLSPNPWKVAIILEELKLPYEMISVEDCKAEWFLKINPNGRLPALEDPNTGVTTWESGSNVDYLINTYDKSYALTYPPTATESHLLRNWAHFQMSGQGPYFGQKAWFSRFHPEKLPSAIERYAKEIDRVFGVIDLHLSTTGQEYLVGDKVTYADLMFVPWNSLLGFLLDDYDLKAKHPKTYEWHQKLMAREAVKKVEAVRAEHLPK